MHVLHMKHELSRFENHFGRKEPFLISSCTKTSTMSIYKWNSCSLQSDESLVGQTSLETFFPESHMDVLLFFTHVDGLLNHVAIHVV
jgi:hypothetical protein